MATLNEIAVLVAEPLGRALDEAFKEQVKARAKAWRSKLIRDTLNRNPKDRAFFTQRITLVLEEASATECGLQLPCKVLRTKDKVPTVVRANNILFDFVGSTDGSNPFKYYTAWQFKYALASKYASLVTDGYGLTNERIVLHKNKLMSHVAVEAIFDDPEQAYIASCGDEGCLFEDTEYPIPGDLTQQIVQYILQVDFNRQPIDQPKTEVNVDNNGVRQQ